MQEIRLNEYRVQIKGLQLTLGTWDSYGIEKLKIIPGTGWEGLTITATFVTPEGSTRVLVPQDGMLPVPQEATAHPLPSGSQGQIVFTGVAEGIQRISTNVLYIVSDHAPIEGEDSHPTPSEFAQFVAQVKGDASDAKKSATEAADSATQAGQSAEKADKSAQSAEEALEQVQATGNSALQSIGAAKSDALSSIGTAQTTAVDSVQQAQQSAVQAVEQAGQTATKQVQDEGTTQAKAVTEAGNAKLQQIEEVNALLPTPTEADAGKAPIAQPDGTYALQEVTVDAYTKAESDARYAPIEGAIKVNGNGTGFVNLSPTIAWKLQSIQIYGRSWQDGTPSIEQEVPIQSTGQSGGVEVTLCGKNLCPYFERSVTKYSNILPKAELGYVYDALSKVIVPGNQYRLSASVLYDGTDYSAEFYIGISYKGGGWISIFGNKPTTESSSGKYDEIQYIYYYMGPNVADNKTRTLKDVMLIAGTENSPSYEPYKHQDCNIIAQNGLIGIPVDSGGNWMDENGQQWISDVVDLLEGTKTQYCGRIESYNGEEIAAPYISSTGALTIGASVVYVLPEPVTIPLDVETTVAYKALKSYPGATNIIATEAGIEASVLAEPNKWVEDKIKEATTQAVQNAILLTGGQT